MAFEISKSFNLMESAIHFRNIRQDLIASNIANASTPFYKPRDIRFEEYLENEAKKEFNVPTHKLELAKTNPMHLNPIDDNDNSKPIVFIRDGHLEKNDGNSVDIDVETSEMAKNTVMINALSEAIKKQMQMFKDAIDSSKNI